MNFLKGEAVACQRKVYLNAICCAGASPTLGGSWVSKFAAGDVCSLSHLEVMMLAFTVTRLALGEISRVSFISGEIVALTDLHQKAACGGYGP